MNGDVANSVGATFIGADIDVFESGKQSLWSRAADHAWKLEVGSWSQVGYPHSTHYTNGFGEPANQNGRYYPSRQT
jgi:hypothetical protein